MKLNGQAKQWLLPSLAALLALLGAAQAAQGGCLSPSSASGNSATTVYRCLEQQGTTARQDPLAIPDKTTVVERGSADVPWFTRKAAAEVMRPIGPVPQARSEEPPEPLPQAQPAQVEKIAEAKPDKPVLQKKPQRKKLVKLKPGKAKATKALAAKTKPVKKAATKPERQAAKAKTEPGKPDDNTVVWTRKDMPLGNRIVNWLGL